MKTLNPTRKAYVIIALYFAVALVIATILTSCNPMQKLSSCDTYSTTAKKSKPLYPQTFLKDAARK